MNLRVPFFTRARITTRLLLWFLAISLIPCSALTWIVTLLSRRSLESSVRERLLAVSDARIRRLESYVVERRGDIEITGRSSNAVEAIARLSTVLKQARPGSPEHRREEEKHKGFFIQYSEVYGYDNVYLFSTDGSLLFSLKPGINPATNLLTGPLKDTQLGSAFYRALVLIQAVLSNYQVYAESNKPEAFLAHPALDEGKIVGVLVFQLNNDKVFSVFSDTNGLGETGEAIVAMRRGDELVFVSPLRYDPAAAFQRTVRLGKEVGIPMQNAVLGRQGYGETYDYRGVRVIAVSSYVPSFRWGMVVKQDAAEAYELINLQRLATGALLGATVLIVVLVALVVAKSMTRPIREAAEVANRVAAGDLTASVTLSAPGEAGLLLQAVRKMTQDLRSLIGRIQKSSVVLMSTATEIAATARQQEQGIHEYGASTSQAAAAVKEISATGQELLKTMTEVNEVAGHTAAMVSDGKEGLAGISQAMRQLADSTASISSKLSVISERAANINLVVTTITKVADQTNLLSINAAIEAEKAGEYGLGFLVVAREIRRLADQTAVATLDIERMVKDMQSSVSTGVMEMDKFSEQVRAGVVDVGRISEQLSQIITAVQGLTERFDQVTEGMRVQAVGANQIREAVVRLSEGIQQALVSLHEFNKATDNMRGAVSGLKEEVSRFKIGSTDSGTFSNV